MKTKRLTPATSAKPQELECLWGYLFLKLMSMGFSSNSKIGLYLTWLPQPSEHKHFCYLFINTWSFHAHKSLHSTKDSSADKNSDLLQSWQNYLTVTWRINISEIYGIFQQYGLFSRMQVSVPIHHNVDSSASLVSSEKDLDW